MDSTSKQSFTHTIRFICYRNDWTVDDSLQ